MNFTSNPLESSTSDYPYEIFECFFWSTDEPCFFASHGNHFLPILYSLYFLVGFLGNILVFWIIMMGAKLRSMTDVCLVNLAVADLLLVLSLPFLAYYAGHDWIFGQVMCTMVLGIHYVGFYGGIFCIILMSIDIYLAVVHAVFALRVRTKKYGIMASLVIWIIAVLASFPELVFLKVEKDDNWELLCSAYPINEESIVQDHTLRSVGLFKMNIVGLLIPLIVVGFCYSMVLRRLLTICPSKKFPIRLVIIVNAVFFCCWTPYNIAAFIKGLELKNIIAANCETSKIIQSALQITEAVSYLHSCLNPFLYVFIGGRFKRHLIKFMKSQNADSVYSQTTSVDE